MRNTKLTPNRILLVVLVAAAVLAGALIAVSVTGSGGGKSEPTAVAGATDTSSLLAGIRQSGNVLGDPKAPVTLVEYADLQCPYCAQWASETLPVLIRDYVRPGKVRLVFNGIAFIGPESESALRASFAAGGQNKLWHVVDLLFRNQGQENTGWVTEDFLHSVGKSVAGLDAGKMLDDRTATSTESAIAAAAEAATGFFGGQIHTPAFQVGRTNGALEELPIKSLDEAAFRPRLDQLLSQ